VAEALSEVANATTGCLRFSARPTVSEHDLADTIVFRQMPASSNVSIPSCVLATAGKLPFNFVYINFTCPNVKGEILHGLLHALGVVHEHNRLDRDDHMVVEWSKLSPRGLGYFLLDRPQFVSTFGTPFDFGSIMMYPQSIGVAQHGDQSFVPKNASDVGSSSIGQRTGLSCADGDILRRMYCCSQSCFDRQGVCGLFATKGECGSKTSWSWMKTNCPRSCGQCCKLGCPSGDCGDYCEQHTRWSLCAGPLCYSH